ncbi:hypothetical protein [Moorena producens]|uniref:hypothetical protein n=1 Tax=Moorena producens TaxID=1155739 RepID=UPI003C727BA3
MQVNRVFFRSNITESFDNSKSIQSEFPYSLLPTPYSLLPTPYSLLPTPCSLFPVPFTINLHRSIISI